MSTPPSPSISSEPSLDRERVRALGLEAGLRAVGFTHAEPFREAKVALETRRAHGRHGEMNFTYRNPSRSTDPRRIVKRAQTLIVGAWPYASQCADSVDSTTHGPAASVAAYAWRDHYGDLRQALTAMADPLRTSGYTARVIADDNALVDRAAAVRAGLGWTGKNSNVLVPGQGSWFVLGAVVTDAPFEPDTPIADQCGSCRRCLDGCPTGAIVAEGVVDARRCLAWLLQAPGEFPLEFREALGTRIYGCDDCQTVCPPSRTPVADLVGDEVVSHAIFDILTLGDDELMDRVDAWYIPKRDPNVVRRNALVALGNANLAPAEVATARELLDRYEFGVDGTRPDPMLAEHAKWARTRLAGT